MFRFSILFAGLFSFFLGPVSADLLVNGDFELGSAGFTNDHTLGSIGSGADIFEMLTDPNLSNSNATSYGDHTTGTGLMLAINGATNPNEIAWVQTVNVDANVDYEFSFWISTWSNRPIDAIVSIEINDVQIGSLTLAPDSPGFWIFDSRDWNSGTATTAKIEIINTVGASIGNDFALDDLQFTTVPEPNTVIFVATGSILIWRRNRTC